MRPLAHHMGVLRLILHVRICQLDVEVLVN